MCSPKPRHLNCVSLLLGYRPQGKGDDPDFHEHIGPENEKEPSPPLKELDGGVAAESV